MSIRVTATISGVDSTTAEFKQARREVYRRTQRGIKQAGEKAILPHARRETASDSPTDPGQIVVKTTSQYGYLTTRTKKAGRIVGLLNFGGILHAPVVPKKKQAVAFGGVVVAKVTSPRHYKGKHFLEKSIIQGLPMYTTVLLKEIMHAFDGLEHTP
jgi:hypothetical protein